MSKRLSEGDHVGRAPKAFCMNGSNDNSISSSLNEAQLEAIIGSPFNTSYGSGGNDGLHGCTSSSTTKATNFYHQNHSAGGSMPLAPSYNLQQQQQQQHRHSLNSQGSRLSSEPPNSLMQSPSPSMIFPGSLSPAALVPRIAREEEEKREIMRSQRRNRVLPLHGPTSECVLQYLKTGHDFMVTIAGATVAQKSYGNEKRCFCPPPSVIFHGWDWINSKASDQRPYLYVGIEESGSDAHKIDVDDDGWASAKHLFISDSDKRKNFSLYAKVVFPTGRILGTFKSKPIKVISKPSKKMKSVKNPELCVPSGSEVTLFLRVRSANIQPRYLSIRDGVFIGSTARWGTICLTAISDPTGDGDGHAAVADNFRSGRRQTPFIQYGMAVVLQCPITHHRSRQLTIRKVEKSYAVPGADDPVSQLHKIALLVAGTTNSYISLLKDELSTVESVTENGKELIPDAAGWTIVSTDKIQYSFNDTFCPNVASVAPVPLVDYIKVQHKRQVEFHGENFAPNLKVWFNDVPAQTLYRCEEMLLAQPPPIIDISNGAMSHCSKLTKVKLSLVRDDGVIYSTPYSYTYDVEPPPRE